MDIVSLFFSTRGRIRRSTWWYAHAGLLAAFLIAMVGFYVTRSRVMNADLRDILPGGRAWTDATILPQLLVIAVYGWSSACLDVKRWHDRGKPWPFVLISLLPQLSGFCRSVGVTSEYLMLPLGVVAAIGGVWTLIECGFLPGDEATNAYGPSPKADPGAAI